MNNKTKGTLMLLPIICVMLAIFITEPVFLLIFGMFAGLAILGLTTIKGLNLLETPDKKEE